MNELLDIKKKIENMDVKNQIEILKLFKKHPEIKLNENKNGTFINITNLNVEILNEIIELIGYIENQQSILNKDEMKKSKLEEIFFNK